MLFRSARGAGDRTKLIAMSASVLSFNRDDAFAAGCDDFLPKPFREVDLLARLGLALQLKWIFKDDETGVDAQKSTAPASSVCQLPVTVIEELRTIARRGEIAQLRRRLDGLRGYPLVDALAPLAKTYRMDRIRELLDQQLASQPPSV